MIQKLKGYLPPPDWDEFNALFISVERVDYNHVRDLAFQLLDRLDGPLAERARRNNPTIAELLMTSLSKVP